MAANMEHGAGRLESLDTMKKLRRHVRLSQLTFALGVLLMVIVGYVEDDPTIPPILLIVLGIGWFIVTKVRMRSHHT
jgi:hypothetical protein